jgi:predicted DNA repair protein MutK
MPTGLVALLDDISVIARAAASSLDDVAAAATKAGTKAAGVVIDDAAVTPSYVTEFTPDRELPVIARIARGSLFNKLVILLPAAIALSALLPAAITPLLMAGGLFLCFEGAEKLLEKFGAEKIGETLDDQPTDAASFENARVSGAIRTDLILSAEIMAIALAEVSDEGLVQQALILAVVGIAITVAVYGAVGLIVKMDDIGLHLSKKTSAMGKSTGRFLLRAMPVLLTLLATVGTAAMLWVGGGIILHGLEELGVHAPAEMAHGVQHAVELATGPLGGVLGWLTYAVLSAVVGLVLGSVVAGAVHLVGMMRGKH